MGPLEIWMKCQISNFKLIILIDFWGITCEIALRRISMDFIDDKSILIQVLAWCRQAVRQQAITWANVDPGLCRYMASLGYNELYVCTA